MTATTSKQLLDPLLVLTQAEVGEGDTVADFGCGPVGHFIFPASRIVGAEGGVYAIDIQKSVLTSVESRVRLDNLHNVTVLWGDIERASGVRVDDQFFDAVLIVNNLFMAKKTASLAEEARRTLRFEGRLVVVDWNTLDSPIGPATKDRVSATQAEALFVEHGFSLDHAFTPGPYHWGLVFRRRS